jgi:hypothetical protein
VGTGEETSTRTDPNAGVEKQADGIARAEEVMTLSESARVAADAKRRPLGEHTKGSRG